MNGERRAAYDDALAFLFPRTTQIKFGLDTTRALLEVLGHPERQFASIHIGGTNGKGSTATLVANALQHHGVRTGLYTSPHLVSFRERIRVGGVPISREAVTIWVDVLRATIEALQATFFEVSTAIAFADFAARGVEVAVVEVGLGGRLDSTNVLDPLVSAVTHIALDHQKHLGETIEEIAREKAGIAKSRVPFVIGERDPYRAALLRKAVEEFADVERGSAASRPRLDASEQARITLVPPEAEYRGPLALLGPHQRRNAAVAEAILAVLPAGLQPTPTEVAEAFATTRMPGRLDRRGRWLYDVAHNPDGMATLVEALAELRPSRPIHALVSILGDKDWPAMLVALDQAIDVGILTLAPTAAARGWDLEWLARWLASADRPPALAEWHLEPDFQAALHRVEQGAGTVLVTGSFHTVGDVLEAKGNTAA